MGFHRLQQSVISAFHRSRSDDEDPRATDSVSLLRHLASVASASSLSIGVQEQAEDMLVPPLLRNCLTLMTAFPSYYLPSRTVVLAIVFTV